MTFLLLSLQNGGSLAAGKRWTSVACQRNFNDVVSKRQKGRAVPASSEPSRPFCDSVFVDCGQASLHFGKHSQASIRVVLWCANILCITVAVWKDCLQNKSAYSVNNNYTKHIKICTI